MVACRILSQLGVAFQLQRRLLSDLLSFIQGCHRFSEQGHNVFAR